MMNDADTEKRGTSCPGCGDDGFRDYMIDEFTDGDGGVSVTTAICENHDCRVRDFYVPREEES